MVRKHSNSLILKSGVNFNSFSDMQISFTKDAAPNFTQNIQHPSINIIEDDVTLNVKKPTTIKSFGYLGYDSVSSVSLDSVTDIEDQNEFKSNKSIGDKRTSFQSDLFYDDSRSPLKMCRFDEITLNLQDNEFSSIIKISIDRIDTLETDYKGEFDHMKEYQELKAHVKEIDQELSELGKTPLLYLNVDVDLTSNAVRTKENNMANWLCRLVQIDSDSDVILCQGGSLRSMTAYPKGHIFTKGDLTAMTAIMDHYEYALCTGSNLIKILENSYRGIPNALGCFIHLAGADVEIDSNKNYSWDELELFLH